MSEPQCCRRHWREAVQKRMEAEGHSAILAICMPYSCAICGNKRCPHGTNCELACTNSNKPGQPGSDYE